MTEHVNNYIFVNFDPKKIKYFEKNIRLLKTKNFLLCVAVTCSVWSILILNEELQKLKDKIEELKVNNVENVYYGYCTDFSKENEKGNE